jgi:hypothetical protein
MFLTFLMGRQVEKKTLGPLREEGRREVSPPNGPSSEFIFTPEEWGKHTILKTEVRSKLANTSST